MEIDKSIIDKFSGKLKEILIEELQSGNEVVEVYEGDWPCPNAIMIFLRKPFVTPIQRNLLDIEFRNINDAHWWKAEYADKKNKMWLFCKFDGPDFEPL